LALRRHSLPRYWLGLTLGGVALLCGLAYWWERQLPERLATAVREGDHAACLHYSEQLAALRWLGQQVPEEQATCRRRAALEAWQSKRHAEALQFQEQLVNAGIGSKEEQKADLRRLQHWREELQRQALTLFKQGDLEAALLVLQPIEKSLHPRGERLSDSLRETWNRNQLDHQRLANLVKDKRWWEALAVLNRLDHPWWRSQAKSLRTTIETAIDARKDSEEHHNHGDLPAHTVPQADLDKAVQARIAAGMEPWQAFLSGCKDVGGRVVEEGPESLCRRR
jgi:hypothetical protein